MNNNFIKNVKNPDLDNDVAGEKYVETRVKLRASKRDLEFYLPLCGTEKNDRSSKHE